MACFSHSFGSGVFTVGNGRRVAAGSGAGARAKAAFVVPPTPVSAPDGRSVASSLGAVLLSRAWMIFVNVESDELAVPPPLPPQQPCTSPQTDVKPGLQAPSGPAEGLHFERPRSLFIFIIPVGGNLPVFLLL